jgi:hypothetical protein
MTHMKRNSLFLLLIICEIAAVMIGLIIAPMILPPRGSPPPPAIPINDDLMGLLLTIKTVISFVNIVLILPLLGIYWDLYREVRSQFTIGLILVVFALLLYAITSNPLLHVFFGYSITGIGPFAIIPDLFSTFALVVLLYLSTE